MTLVEESQHRSSRRLALRQAVSRVLADAPTPADALPRLIEALCSACGWVAGAHWQRASEAAAIQCEHVWHSDPARNSELYRTWRGFELALGEGIPGRVWQTGQAEWSTDVTHDSGFVRSAAAARLGLRAAFAFPIQVADGVTGVLEFFSETPEEPDEELLATLKSVGSEIGQFVARARAQEAVALSEAVKTAVLESALDGIITIDALGRVVEFNPAAERTFGWRRAEVLGQELGQFILPERYREAYRQDLARWLATGKGEMLGKRIEMTGMQKDGKELPVELVITSIGGTGLCTAYLRDLSERKRAEAVSQLMAAASKVLASSFDFDTTLQHIAHMAVPTLADWCVIDVSVDGHELMRRIVEHPDPHKRALAQRLQEKYPPRPDAAHGVAAVMRSGRSMLVTEISPAMLRAASVNDEHMALVSELALCSFMTVPLRARGRVVGAISFASSESERHYDEADLAIAEELARRASVALENALLFAEREQLIHALERSNTDLSQFAYVTSHDLRAPLRAIANLSQWIEDDLAPVLTSEVRQHLGLLRGRVRRLESLIDGVLKYAKAGHADEKIESVDVHALLVETIDMLAPATLASIEIAAGMPVLMTQRVPLQQVFMNLIGNAMKHARRPDLKVVIGVREVGVVWEFSVSDNGPGIAAAYHERIWAIFQTLEARDKVESTGMGLAVVRKIVEQKGGRAWVVSSLGEGATFYFTWPWRGLS